MIKVMSVIGTRPEAIKMAPVINALKQHPEQITSLVCSTGQHRQMLDQVLNLFDIVPDIDLNLMQANQSLAGLTARLITGIDRVMKAHRPDWVLVQGDTTTVFAAALAAFYHGVRVGHVEAGLRTGDKYQPFPEEINRRMVDVIADLYFAPTETNRQNLLRENLNAQTVHVTGNTVIDALLMIAEQVKTAPLSLLIPKAARKKMILVTAHRRENHGQPIREICHALVTLARCYADTVHIVYPVHLNPNIEQPVYALLDHIPNISLLPPVDYQTMVRLLTHAHLILTDSGGIQEEAPSLNKPVLVLRETTERPEAVAAGVTRLVGTKTEAIVEAVTSLLEDETLYRTMATGANPYGDGHASQRIVQALLEA